MFIKLNIWEILKSIASPKSLSRYEQSTLLVNAETSIQEGFNGYNKLPQEEKDRLCINLAHKMGCDSDDVLICSNYIYQYAHNEKVG
jgi:hypothetical protein